MTTQLYPQPAPVSTPTPVHSHTALDATATVKRWAAQHGASYAETERLAKLYIPDAKSDWQVALFAAAESLAGAERIAEAVAYAGRASWQYKPTSTSSSGYVTTHYKFAPSSHRSKRVRNCRDCAKLGRKCWRHDGHKAVTK